MADEDFQLHECTLVRCATGRACSNLRELMEALRSVGDSVLQHHMVRCALEDHFELYEFPNDLSRWCWDALGERQLAEELALVNPYAVTTTEELRTVILNTIEDRLWTIERVPWCRPGLELHLVDSRLISFDTGERFASLAALAEALPRVSLRSLYYHVHEAHRRQGVDDFSLWLEKSGRSAGLINKLRRIDFYFLNLAQLRQQLFNALCTEIAEPAAVLGELR